MALQWYVGITQSMREKVALRELGNQGFEAYLPMCVATSARRIRVKPFLAPYIFIRIDTQDRNTRWRAVYNTRGISGVISSGDKPQPVGDWVIEEIRSREVDGLVKLKPKEKCRYVKGDAVKVKGSPLDAVFLEVVDDRRAAIFVSLLGRSWRELVPMAKLRSSAVQA